MDDSSAQPNAATHPDFENLDRSVLFAAIGGILFNGLVETSLPSIMLTVLATLIYGLARNRIANVNAFKDMDNPPAHLGIDVHCFTSWCQWFASRQLRDGLLGDLIDPTVGGTPEAARQYLRETLCLAICVRTKEKMVALLWLDHYL